MTIKILYKIILCSLTTYAILLTLYLILPIEFTNDKLKELTFRLIWYTGPVLFLMTLLKLLIVRKSKRETISQIISTIIISTTIFVFLGLYWFMAVMSVNRQDKVLFVNKNSTERILLRHHDVGGAFDSEIPKFELNKIIPLTEYFQLYLKVDTTGIDNETWIRAEN